MSGKLTWQSFFYRNGTVATCKDEKCAYSTDIGKGRSTSSLRHHLEHHHKKLYEEKILHDKSTAQNLKRKTNLSGAQRSIFTRHFPASESSLQSTSKAGGSRQLTIESSYSKSFSFLSR
jgi:hypothetical protein